MEGEMRGEIDSLEIVLIGYRPGRFFAKQLVW